MDNNIKEQLVKKSVEDLKPDPSMNLSPLSYEFLKELSSHLGEDVQNCVGDISQVVKIESPEVLEAYSEIYKRFQTLPYFFCTSSRKGGYLWQINRLCPYKPDSNSFILDYRTEGAKKCFHISFLMLAKFTFGEDKPFVNVKLLDDKQLIVSTTIGYELVLRLYDVTSFVSNAKVNPYKQVAITSNFYSHKLVMKSISTEGLFNSGLEFTLWRRLTSGEPASEMKNPEEQDGLVTRIVNNSFTAQNTYYSVIKKSKNGVILLIDVNKSNILMWRGDEILSVPAQLDNEYVFVEDEDKIILTSHKIPQYMRNSSYCMKNHKIFFGKFPVIHRGTETWDSPKYEELRKKVNDDDYQKQLLRANLFNPKDPRHNIYIYSTPISLVNPFLTDKNATKTTTIEADKGEKSLLEKVVTTVSQIKQSKSELSKMQKQKEILRGIRADIRMRVEEIKKCEEEQDKDPEKVVEKPDEVSEDVLAMYAQQKMEKKRIAKGREKEKCQKKKSRVLRESY